MNRKVLFALVCIVFASAISGNSSEDFNKFCLDSYPRIKINGSTIIIIPEGDYLVEGTIVISSNTTIKGNGEQTTLHFSQPFPDSRLVTNANHHEGDKNISLRSFCIQFESNLLGNGNDKGLLRFENVDNLTILDIKANIRSRCYCIDFASNIRNGIVQGCQILNRGSGGAIMVRNGSSLNNKKCYNILIKDCILESQIGDESLAIFGWRGRVENVFIIGNSITADNSSFGMTVFGIDKLLHTGSIKNVSIINNVVKGGRVGGIGIKGGASEVYLIGNKILDSIGDGIFIHKGGRFLPEVNRISVKNCLVSKSGRYGIYASGSKILIEGNTIEETHSAGVFFSGNGSLIKNIISDCYPSVLAKKGSDILFEKNQFRNAPVHWFESVSKNLKRIK